MNHSDYTDDGSVLDELNYCSLVFKSSLMSKELRYFIVTCVNDSGHYSR